MIQKNNDDKKITVMTFVCEFHQKYPDEKFAGCTCSKLYAIGVKIYNICDDCDIDYPSCNKCIGS